MTFARRMAVLTALYMAQGIPFGFQNFAFPVFLRRTGVSVVAITFLSYLSLPWILKPLWAPLVDRFGQTRRAWIVPLMTLLACVFFAAGLADPTEHRGLVLLLGLVLLMNLVAATQDIAVDGLAVDLLSARELGGGNSAQVVGYKLGMLIGGEVFLFASVYLAWSVVFVGMGVVVLVALIAVGFVREKPRRGATAFPSLGSVVKSLKMALTAPGSGGLILFIVTYKLGENMADAIWKTWLVDAGYSDVFIGGAFGVTAMASSICGSLGGGFLATHMSPERALWMPAAGRVLPLLGQAAIAAWGAGHAAVLVVVALVHFFGGALTTIVFALMMSRVDKRIGASHYTVLAGLEVLGKFPSGPLAGITYIYVGYPMTFLIATVLTAVQLVTLPVLNRRKSQVAPAPVASTLGPE